MYMYMYMYIYIVRMGREEIQLFSKLVSAMDCPKVLYIVVYKFEFDVIFSSTMTLWYYNSPFCIRSSKKHCTKNADILEVRELKFGIESMWLEIS